MKASLDCIPCFVRQTLEAVRMVSDDPEVQESMLREVLLWAGKIDLSQPPPVMGQRIHRRLREITGGQDPYRLAKDRQNHLAISLLPELRHELDSSPDRLGMAVRLAIAGNIIDLGVNGTLTESEVEKSIKVALTEPLDYDLDEFKMALNKARSILYLTDNAGEIAFDRLLIENLPQKRITVAVRGSPVINDATMDDALEVGLTGLVEVIGNGSDAPGTVLADCNREFSSLWKKADLIIAKGQGNFETLSDLPENIYFLFKVKCPVIASHTGLKMGSQALLRQGFIQNILGSNQ